MPLQLSPGECRALRSRAHQIEPTVRVGHEGLTPAVAAEVERSLRAHELVKVRVAGDGRAAREDILHRLCDDLDAAPIQHIGKTLVIYRPKIDPDPKPAKPPRRKKPARALKRSFQGRA